jgi:hypothetical protein
VATGVGISRTNPAVPFGKIVEIGEGIVQMLPRLICWSPLYESLPAPPDISEACPTGLRVADRRQ